MHPIFKSRRALPTVAGAVVAAATLMALPATSSAQDDPGYRQYRCTVLGDSLACPAPSLMPADRIDVQTIAGPYAHYLMYLGQNADSAIEAARATTGEVPIRRTVRVTTRQPSPAEAYQRHLGNLTTPAVGYRILAEAPAETSVRQARRVVGD